MANYREDIVDIELTGGSLHRSFCNRAIGAGDEDANRFGIRLFRNGQPENVSGSVMGLFIRADGSTVPIASGTVNGNMAYVTLPEACYDVEGVFSLAIKITGGGITGTMRIVDGTVSRTSTDVAVDPGTIIPSVEDLIEAIEEAAANIPADYSELSTILMKRAAYFPNINAAATMSLNFEYDSNAGQYTVTALKNFSVYGFSWEYGFLSIGRNGSDINYPMPESFSSETNIGQTFHFICFDLDDRTTDTWQIVSYSQMKADDSLVPICAVYRKRTMFFDSNLKVLFKNSVTDEEFLAYEDRRTTGSAFYYPKLCNATALISGKANLLSEENKIIFTNPIFAPSSYVGGFDAGLVNETIELDWSEEPYPNYARGIYYNNMTGQLEAIYAGNLTSDENFSNRIRKNAYALICIVYQGTFVYTCGACVPGKWFVNGRDIYGGASSELPPDLFKAFKKVGVIGDSLSVGYMYNKDTGVATSRMLSYSWPKQLMKNAGVPWLNLGTSGQNVLTWCSNATYGKAQAEASGNKCQAYIIGLGENDQSNSDRGCPLGQPSDIVDDYTHVAATYYGGYARIIQILKHLNPECKIFCLTNPRAGTGRAEYNVAVRYIATEYYDADDNVFLIDLAYDSPELFNAGTFLPVDSATIEGGHYSAIGYARIASIMEKAISKCIETNQTHFVNVAYVEYDTNDPTPNTMTQ